jgi:kynurenine 3-monooxygenase
MAKPIIIAGAGLCGTLLAVRLAQRGFSVELFESRPDMRSTSIAAGRSINLALSDRGLKALRMVGVDKHIEADLIPMTGRMVHHADGRTSYQSYSGRKGECINSVSRSGLNSALLDLADTLPGLNMHFNTTCSSVDLENATAHFQDQGSKKEFSVEGQLVIGADGANSAVRQSMFSQAARLRFDFRIDWLTHGYKELIFPALPDGGFALEKNALHIWPRGGFMMIALPNPGGSFTVTLFLPFKGENGFETMVDGPSVRRYFEKWFPEALTLLPDLETHYFQHPVSSLGTVKCYPWVAYDKNLLLGDAAHAVVPFYGQGMNCSFEDCVVFDECLDELGANWPLVLDRVQTLRKPNADAIADLAIENFYEMRDHVANPVFIRKRQLETLLESQFPDYYSKYSLVTFREDVPYSQAKALGNAQDALLMELCTGNEPIDQMDLEVILKQVKSQTEALRAGI